MSSTNGYWINILISTVLYQAFVLVSGSKVQCPTGFKFVNVSDIKVCSRLKDPEVYDDMYKDCMGNKFTYDLYKKLESQLEAPKGYIWTEYKSIYPGGPVYDLDYKDVKYEVNYRKVDMEEESCVVFDDKDDLLATSCKKKFYRYCFVLPYVEYDRKDTCDSDFLRYYGPRYTCLNYTHDVIAGLGDALFKCGKMGATLLHRGWRHAAELTQNLIPLNANNDTVLHWRIAENNESMVHRHNFETHSWYPGASKVGIQNGTWRYVEPGYIFSEYICEKSIFQNKTLLILRSEGELIRIEPVDNVESLKCFTDSLSYSPKEISVSLGTLGVIKPGYYWCRYINVDELSETNRLFNSNGIKLTSRFAIKIKSNHYKLHERFSSLRTKFKLYLEEYIHILSLFAASNITDIMKIDSDDMEKILKEFKKTNSISAPGSILENLVVKRRYIDQKTLLLHADLVKDKIPARPGTWEDIRIIYMKPIYFCNEPNIKINGSLGDSVIYNSKNYTCLGDHNDGLQWVLMDEIKSDVVLNSTKARTRISYDSSEESSSDYDYIDTTTSPRPRPTSTSRKPTTQPPATTTTSHEVLTTPTPLPQEALDEVVQSIKDLLENDTAITVQDVQTKFGKVSNILDVEEDLTIPTELLRLIDDMGQRVDLDGRDTDMAVERNLAIVMTQASVDHPVRGLRVSKRESDEFDNNTFEVIRDSHVLNTSQLYVNESEAVIDLPSSLQISNRRINFVVFRNDRAFLSTDPKYYALNSRIVSVTVENFTSFESGEVIDIYFKPNQASVERNLSRQCVYYEFDKFENDSFSGDGDWSEEGCTLVKTEEHMLDICRCTHLTHFAEILVSRTIFSDTHENALELVSLVGCILSLIGLFFIGLTATLFRSWRKDYSNKVWLQLCIAIFILIVCFMIVALADFNKYSVFCMLTGVVLHYSVLASFCWMLVAAMLAYRRLVLIFTRDFSHKLLKAAAFAWGTPFAIIGILLAVSPEAYKTSFEDKLSSSSFCYPSGLEHWLTIILPIGIMLTINWLLFGLILRSVFCTSKRVSRHMGDTNEALKCASVSFFLVFLFGLPWIFGLLSENIVMAYFFAVTAAFQGFVLFIFFVVGNKKTRDLWLNKLKMKRTQMIPVTTSTVTNRTGGAVVNSQSGLNILRGKSNKPLSLSSRDDASFS